VELIPQRGLPDLLSFGVYQNFGWSIAKSTSRNVQVKLVTACNSPSGVGLTLIVQARGLLQPPFTLGPTPPTESVTNGDSKWHRSIDRKAGCIFDAQGSLFSVVIGSFAGSVAHLYSWIAWLFRLANC
jgi:hypothetical protein